MPINLFSGEENETENSYSLSEFLGEVVFLLNQKIIQTENSLQSIYSQATRGNGLKRTIQFCVHGLIW